MPRLTCALIFAVTILAACGADPEPEAPTASDVLTDTLALDPRPNVDPETARVQALETALDSLEALVGVLERVEGPVAAWNRAAEAARLLRYLEQHRAAFALDVSKEEAMARYPEQIRRLDTLEARRTAELERINEDPIAARVLVEEMAKADAAADTTDAGR